MKKILIDLCKLSNLNCGLGQVALNFGKAISETNFKYELHFLVPKEFIGYFNGHSVIYHTKKDIKKLLSSNMFALWHSIHQEPDILPQDNTPILLTIHDLNFLEEKSDKKAKKRLKKLQNIVNKCSDFVFISEFSKSVAESNLDLKQKKLSVIYNGVSILNKEKPINNIDSRFFFSIGVFKKKKNFHTLIPVMKNFPGYKLIIAGDNTGSYAKELVNLTKHEGLTDRIIFLGSIREEEKTWLYRNCEAFLFPSLYEGFGLPVIEAMRNGVPVITSDKTSLPEIGGGFTFLFDDFNPESMTRTINNSLKTFNSDPLFKENQIKYANTFQWEKNSKNYLDEYDFLITQYYKA